VRDKSIEEQKEKPSEARFFDRRMDARHNAFGFSTDQADETGVTTTSSVFTFTLPPGAVRKFVSSSTGGLNSGFASVTTNSGTVSGTAIFSEFDAAGHLPCAAEVPAATPVLRQTILVDTTSGCLGDGLLWICSGSSGPRFGEGAAFPGALRTAAESLPQETQSRGMALGYSGASLGAIITPLLVTPLALMYGWQIAFLITGGLGALWLIMWLFISRPPFLPRSKPASALKMIWPNLLERRFWVICSSFGLGAVALGIVAYLSPLYLNRALGLTQPQLGKVLWIPLVGWEAGYFFWGWVADRYLTDMPDRRKPARIFLLLTVLGLPSLLVTQTRSVPVVLALFFWATFVADGFVVTSRRVGVRIYSKDRTAMVGGIGSGSWSAVQAIVLPIYGKWVDWRWFGIIFVTMTLAPILGTSLWFWLSSKDELWQEN
jgi:ACS family hexuronate transporter-like MFS transporter